SLSDSSRNRFICAPNIMRSIPILSSLRFCRSYNARPGRAIKKKRRIAVRSRLLALSSSGSSPVPRKPVRDHVNRSWSRQINPVLLRIRRGSHHPDGDRQSLRSGTCLCAREYDCDGRLWRQHFTSPHQVLKQKGRPENPPPSGHEGLVAPYQNISRKLNWMSLGDPTVDEITPAAAL